jgi:subtilisin-like proprotein convertase family protein
MKIISQGRTAVFVCGMLGLGWANMNVLAVEILTFCAPQKTIYRLVDRDQQAFVDATPQWVKAYVEDGSTNLVEFGSRIVLQLRFGDDLQKLIAGRALELSRVIASNIFILQAPDALTAVRVAQQLATEADVVACYPIMQREAATHGPYAQRSNDPFAIPYFVTGLGQTIESQWPIENRFGDSTRRGLDLNIMAAWPYGMGQGVTVAVVDSGLEMNHPELTNRLAGAPHYNFTGQNTNTGPAGGGQFDPLRVLWSHGTEVAGLIAATGNNNKGMIGIAPQASLASWLIYATNGGLASDEQLMDMYESAPDVVSVQNHSWGAGNGLKQQRGPTLLEQVGIQNAVTLGRSGRGIVMVRSAGNDRSIAANANDDGYMDDPQVITVAAVTQSGRATSYSEPGACVLIGAPGGGGDTPQGLFTLDLVGSDRGVNSGIIYGGDIADYAFGVQGFIGTSASAPLVSGIAAILLSVNTNLAYRDVQQIMAMSARHWDLADPDMTTNSAGFQVSHNVGFGVPDAGHAAGLAKTWSNRPPLVTFSTTDTQSLPILDNGLRIEVTGSNIPSELASIPCFPTYAPHPDQPTTALPLVDVGVATNVPAQNLTNKGALILRNATAFETKISNAAKAGAAFAIIYNPTNGGSFNLGLVSGTAYSPIPTVFIGNSVGENLKSLFQTNASASARLRLLTADKVFHVNSTLLCEQVGVRVWTDHPLRGDLRITLRSPQGTRSVLQHFNDDTSAGPVGWTYWTTHHLFESSAGDWTVSVSDEFAGVTGSLLGVSLIIRGTPINDIDADGLDDTWEQAWFGTLAYGPKDDPDSDGFSNAREQLMATSPQASDIFSAPSLARWGLFGSNLMRVSWPSNPQHTYEIRSGTNLAVLNVTNNLPGRFPETEWFAPYSAAQNGFFKVRAVQNSQ